MVRRALVFKGSGALHRIDLHPANRIDNFAIHLRHHFTGVYPVPSSSALGTICQVAFSREVHVEILL